MPSNTGDGVLAKGKVKYAGANTVGDVRQRIKAVDPTYGTRDWYVTQLAALGQAHAANAHLGDLAYLFWNHASASTRLP
jgi:hypothetical protein